MVRNLINNLWITRIRAVLEELVEYYNRDKQYNGKNKAGRRATNPANTVTLFHPDYNRRPRNCTGSADL